MTAIKTKIGGRDQAGETSFPPSATIPQTDTWRAIQYVYDTLAPLIAAISDVADYSRSLAQTALASARRGERTARQAQAAAEDARSLAQVAQGTTQRARLARQAIAAAEDARQLALVTRGQAQRIQKDVLRINDAQIALKAQVFN